MATSLENCERTKHNFVINRDATRFVCSHGCGERRMSAVGYELLDADTTFVATRTISGALMDFHGAIAVGERVCFRQAGNGTFYLDYESGAPTVCPPLADWKSVRAFVEGSGLSLAASLASTEPNPAPTVGG